MTGNYSWLNWVTIIAIVAGISDSAILWSCLASGADGSAACAAAPPWFLAATYAFAMLVVVLSYWPVRNLLSSPPSDEPLVQLAGTW